MYVYVQCFCLELVEARRPSSDPLELEFTAVLFLWAAMKVLRMQLRSSGRAASSLKHWSISPALCFVLFFWDKLSICSWEAILELMAISLPQPPEHWYSSCELSQGYLSVPCSSFLWMYQDALYLLTKVFLFIIVCLSMCACTCVYEHLQRPARSLGAGVTGGMNCLT